MLKNVGGDRIEVTTLAGPNGDTHVYEPTPAYAKAVAGGGLGRQAAILAAAGRFHGSA